MSVTFINTFTAKDGQEDAFVNMAKDWSANLNQVPGCSEMKIYRQSDDPHKVVLIEQWDSQEAHMAFVDSMAENGGMDEPMKLLQGMPEGTFLNAQ